MTLVIGGTTELKLLGKPLIQKMVPTWYRQHFGWSVETSSRSRAVITHRSLLYCRPQVIVLVDRHSDLKSQALATSGMVQFGMRTDVWGIVKYSIVDNTKQRKVLDKRDAMVPSKSAIGSGSGVTMDGVAL